MVSCQARAVVSWSTTIGKRERSSKCSRRAMADSTRRRSRMSRMLPTSSAHSPGTTALPSIIARNTPRASSERSSSISAATVIDASRTHVTTGCRSAAAFFAQRPHLGLRQANAPRGERLAPGCNTIKRRQCLLDILSSFRNQARHGTPMTGDDDLLAALHAVEELRQVGLGLIRAHGRHSSEIIHEQYLDQWSDQCKATHENWLHYVARHQTPC